MQRARDGDDGGGVAGLPTPGSRVTRHAPGYPFRQGIFKIVFIVNKSIIIFLIH